MQSKQNYNPFQFLLNLDMFGAKLPDLNMDGKKLVRTTLGAFTSIIIISLTATFAIVKLQFMLMRKRPDVFEIAQQNPYDEFYRYNIAENDF